MTRFTFQRHSLDDRNMCPPVCCCLLICKQNKTSCKICGIWN